jgi:hypothetical protein
MMKYLFSLLLFFSCVVNLSAQKETFGFVTYTPPRGWKKQMAESGVQFTKEDTAKGTYCLVTLYKAVPATADSKDNFDLAWTSIVKEMVTVSVLPEMQPVVTENGWEVQTGYAPFEKDGNKGVVLLVTSSGYEKMVNLVILTNTDIYEKNITDFLASAHLKKTGVEKQLSPNIPVGQQATKKTGKPANQPTANANGFAFTTTNFDDGWTSTIKEGWVQVDKENTKVLIHYPDKKVDEYNPDLLQGLKEAWNVLVAPRYNITGSTEFKPVSGWQSIEFAEADAVEKTTGKTVHVVLFKINYSGGNGKYLEFITPDKKSFELQFGPYRQESFGWEKMEAMANYNKFAVAASDLTGKWTTKFSGFTQYVNVYTGLSAGMDTHASNEAYEFGAGNTYKWDLAVASGMVGNIKFQSVKSNGKLSMKDNWHIYLSDIEGKPRTYDIYFSCIKGFRILWIDNNAFAKVE